MYKLIAIAGTFDRLHRGHLFFISEAFKYGERVLIGLTSDEYVERKIQISNSKSQINTKISITNYQTRKIESGEDTSDGVPMRSGLLRGGGIKIQSYSMRKKELEEYLRSEKLIDRTEIVEINDVYGSAIEVNNIEALVVTKDSKNGGEKVNQKRIQLGLKPLKLIVVPLVNADDKKRIASTRIRLGEIDRWGHLYKLKAQSEKLKVEGKIRLELKKPQGVLIKGDKDNFDKIVPELQTLIRKLHPVMISTIGDEVTRICNKNGLTPELAIFDYKVNRIKKYHSLAELGFLDTKALKTPQGWQARHKLVAWQAASHDSPGVERSIRVRNPAGNISRSLVRAVEKAIKGIISDGRQRLIRVIGEDDLAAVPAILLSPLGSVVIYGQPGEGVVLVEVTEEKKEKIVKLLAND